MNDTTDTTDTTENTVDDTMDTRKPHTEVFDLYNHAWKQMWKYFLELFLVTLISAVAMAPMAWTNQPNTGVSPGMVFLKIFALAYWLLVFSPIDYGAYFVALRASRGEKLQVKDMFYSFENYLNVVLAKLLTTVIIGMGCIFLIVPGIYLACRLVLVPLLVVDRKMEVVEAVKESWRLMEGHSLTAFLLGLLAIPVFFGGLLALCVGVILSVIWINVAFASLYHAVVGNGKHLEEVDILKH